MFVFGQAGGYVHQPARASDVPTPDGASNVRLPEPISVPRKNLSRVFVEALTFLRPDELDTIAKIGPARHSVVAMKAQFRQHLHVLEDYCELLISICPELADSATGYPLRQLYWNDPFNYHLYTFYEQKKEELLDFLVALSPEQRNRLEAGLAADPRAIPTPYEGFMELVTVVAENPSLNNSSSYPLLESVLSRYISQGLFSRALKLSNKLAIYQDLQNDTMLRLVQELCKKGLFKRAIALHDMYDEPKSKLLTVILKEYFDQGLMNEGTDLMLRVLDTTSPRLYVLNYGTTIIEDPNTLVQLIAELTKRNHLETAEALINDSYLGDLKELRLAIFRKYLANSDIEQAKRILSKYFPRHYDLPKYKFEYARTCADLGQLDQALEVINGILFYNTVDREDHRRIIDHLVNSKRYDEARHLASLIVPAIGEHVVSIKGVEYFKFKTDLLQRINDEEMKDN
ncbi:MAG: hypothetical protein SP1CHLAM54_03760 [Chlamydiia bacterium]|nr:hypothetical protein [Chlamydiia bacterium]MCH9615292.1 hypothetical protein [Chlamydiia bacterium]MCH9628386.1 hypothetical protein [Chlamydiia bacterium]